MRRNLRHPWLNFSTGIPGGIPESISEGIPWEINEAILGEVPEGIMERITGGIQRGLPGNNPGEPAEVFLERNVKRVPRPRPRLFRWVTDGSDSDKKSCLSVHSVFSITIHFITIKTCTPTIKHCLSTVLGRLDGPPDVAIRHYLRMNLLHTVCWGLHSEFVFCSLQYLL